MSVQNVNSLDPEDIITSLASSKFDKPLAIDRIFLLLVEMIDALQSVAATQAQRLQFLTAWQRAYTDLMDQVPSFTSDGDAFGGTEDEQNVARDDANRVASTYIEQLRNKRSVIGDDARGLQSNVSQSNDAVEQQSNMATALLQQLSTLLSTIFK